MGVLACDRTNCENVMCDKYIMIDQQMNYICDDCIKELNMYIRSLLKNYWMDQIKLHIDRFLLEFMESPIEEPHFKDEDFKWLYDRILEIRYK